MSVAHGGVSFNHSCLKVPVDPTSKRPAPNYERVYKYSRVGRKSRETSAVSSTNSSSLDHNYKSVESYLEFYEAIPDYSELHHLSDEEFYSRLKSLKITQERFCGGGFPRDRPSSHSSLGKYNPEDVYRKVKDGKKKDGRASSGYSFSSGGKDSENVSNIGLDNSVAESWKNNTEDDGWLSDDGVCSRKSKSVPSSPGWKAKACGYVPGGCDCVVARDCCSMHHHYPKTRDSPKKQRFSTRPVPLLSRIPLYDKIMAEQEERRRVNHSRYSRELRALVQPFSFTKREEEEKQKKMRMTCSNPELRNPSPPAPRPFKAKPIPRHLFSNYAYERMREEDFYRALKKRIRAEEMLRSSSLPPSMAEREKHRSRSLDFLDRKSSRHRRLCDGGHRGPDVASPYEEKQKTQRRRGKFWLNRKGSNSITDSSADVSPYESVSEPERRKQKRPHSAISVNRSNLASVLRMQTTRKRMEKEMADNLEESRLKEQAKFKERLIRMTPAWRALNYSTEEDLALRVAARREEERLKKKRYDKLMGSIYGRVHQMPPLFQRQLSSAKQARRRRDQTAEKSDDATKGTAYGFGKSSESSGKSDEEEMDRYRGERRTEMTDEGLEKGSR